MDITDQEFNKLVEYMQKHFGINLKEKRVLVNGRLQSLQSKLGVSSFSEFFEMVVSDTTKELQFELINKLTTNHTYFAREEAHFEYLRGVILEQLCKKASCNRDLRTWSAGCSSGEEPYTIAMVLAEYFGDKKMSWDTKVLATDISARVLDKAKQGIYPPDQLQLISDVFRTKYFSKLPNGEYKVVDAIRKEVIFRSFNLMNERFPFKKKFHIIFCRNVMIYFDKDTKQALINKFYDALELGGYLIIGHSETLNGLTTDLEYIKPSIYRKI